MAKNRALAAYERLLANAFRKAGWRVARQPRLGKVHPDLVVRRGESSYAIELKSAPEGRRDRLIPLLAQAILQARAIASESPAAPLAVIASPRVPDSLGDDIRRFAREYAPDVAVGVIDLEGFRAFVGPGLEALSSPRSRELPALPAKPSVRPNLFSDLNQWMLKVLLARDLPEQLLSAPRGLYRNASQLGHAACVSVMSAFRFLRLLRMEGFLDEVEPLRLVRVEELMHRWRAAHARPVREWPMRWVLRGDPDEQLEAALRSHLSRASRSGKDSASPRVCLGLFAAADALGLGFVRGVQPHLYIEERRSDLARQLGLMAVEPGHSPDVYLRLPLAPQSVFRGAILRDGVLVADVIQVWLDVADHPSRGHEQALQIKRRVFQPLLAGKS